MTKTRSFLSFLFLAGLAGSALASPTATTSFDPRFCAVSTGSAGGSDAASWAGLAVIGAVGAVAMRRRRG